MNDRDYDYIETRLLAPCMGASEAYERLRKIGEGKIADDLMHAMQAFTDLTRRARTDLTDAYRAERAVGRTR